jgi:hypothetical protein
VWCEKKDDLTAGNGFLKEIDAIDYAAPFVGRGVITGVPDPQ